MFVNCKLETEPTRKVCEHQGTVPCDALNKQSINVLVEAFDIS